MFLATQEISLSLEYLDFDCGLSGPQITLFPQCFYRASLVSCQVSGQCFVFGGLMQGFEESAVGYTDGGEGGGSSTLSFIDIGGVGYSQGYSLGE